MERTWPALVLLALAGGALAMLGWRAHDLERAEARRAAAARAEFAVVKAAETALERARAPRTPPTEAWRVGVTARPAHRDDDEALLLRDAAYRERRDEDPASVLASLERLAARDGEAASVASLRAGLLAERLGRDADARRHLARAATAPRDLSDGEGVVVALAARYRLARRSVEAALDFVRAAEDGGWLGPQDGTGPDDLLLALEADLSRAGDVPRAVADAAARARRGQAALAAVGDGDLGVAGLRVVRRAGAGRLEARPGSTVADDATVVAASNPAARGRDARRLPPPLDALCVVPPPGLRVAAGAVPWTLVGGLAVYVFGAALAVVALARAKRHLRQQADFVAAVSHELKTPIASVRAMAEHLADGAATEPDVAVRYAERIGFEMERLGAAVRNVLDVARIERTGALPVALRPDDPARVVQGVVDASRPGFERRGQPLRVRIEPAAAPVLLDPDALRGVVGNLLDNAVKHGGPAGEVCVEGRPTPSGGYRFAVLDRGEGVPEADRARLFRRFRRGGAARRDARPGVGLGLFVAREVVRAHGGAIRMEPREGGGSVFLVDLPGGRT